MNTAWLLLGGNIGDTHGILNRAIELLGHKTGRVTAQSAVYQTAPWALESDQDFLNQVVSIQTSLDPHALLHCILDIELELGRTRNEGPRYQSRIIDIDILLYESRIVDTSDLVIPHPGLPTRAFALVPLAEIAGSFVHPLLKRSISQLAAECDDTTEVKRLNPTTDAP